MDTVMLHICQLSYKPQGYQIHTNAHCLCNIQLATSNFTQMCICSLCICLCCLNVIVRNILCLEAICFL